jgi:hypothetical protein
MREAARVNENFRTRTFDDGLTVPIRGSAPFAMWPAIMQT